MKEKNIVTLVLDSPNELSNLLSEVSLQAYSQSIDIQFEDMFKPLPSILLTQFELENLKAYVESKEHLDVEKHDKIRGTLEGKTIPQEVETSLHDFFEKIINEDYSLTIKEAILISFQHTNFRKIEYIIKICIELMGLTEMKEFILDFENNNWGSDVLMVIEHKLGIILKDSVECRKWSCVIILGYLEGMIAEHKNLSAKQVQYLLDGLKNYGYEEFDNLGVGFDNINTSKIIEHYLSLHNSTLRTRFNSKSPLGKRRQTVLEIMDEMMKSLPKNLNA